MKTNLNKLNDILNNNLRPWLDENKPDRKFIYKNKEISSIDYDFQNLYQINFFKPFNNKTKYYHKLIINQAIEYCNKIFFLKNKNQDIQYQKFLLDDILNKKLKTKLNETSKLILERNYNNIDIIDPDKTSPLNNQDLKTETYIIQLLKITFIKIYLEIQNFFSSIINKDDILDENDFYSNFFSEPIPDKSFLVRINYKNIIPQNKKSEKSSEKTTYNSFKYIHLKFQSENIKDLFDSLKKNNFVSDKNSLVNFKKIFYGEEISTPVIWTGNKSDLYYFIHLIHNKYKLVEDLKQKHWKVTCKCFVRKDGSPYKFTEFKNLKKPKSTCKLIENAVDLLK